MTLRALIVGGYGIFGGRIVELLKDEPRLELIVAGRSPERAKAFCARQHGRATLEPAVFDRNGDLSHHLTALRPALLIDARRPFQAYGQDRYRVIEACIANRVPYLDLADGADFVDGVQSLDAAARASGVSVLSGVSSFPVLTAAATRRLAVGLARVDAIRAGIAPSSYAIVGENVIRAITGYAGQPSRVRRDGQTMTGYPFTEQMRFTVTPLALWASDHVGWGAHRGGMFVEVEGVDAAGQPVTRSWHLEAEGDDGPLIPSMAIEGIVRRLLDGQRPDAGARAAARELELEDYDRLFARRSIHTGVVGA